MAQPGAPQDESPEEAAKLAGVDREFRAAVAKLTGGLSPQDYAAAWSDWWLHLGASPAKQVELQQSAMQKAMDFWLFATRAASGQPAAPVPGPGPQSVPVTAEAAGRATGGARAALRRPG